MAYVPPGREQRRCRYDWFDKWDWLVNRAISAAGVVRAQARQGDIALDLHIHTLFSHCSISQPEKIIRQAVKLGLNGVAIMDHDDVRGADDALLCALDLKERGIIPEDFLLIPGVEIYSSAGHIGALFARQQFPSFLSPADTVKAIHDAGGLAVAAHPCHRAGIGREVFNAPFDAVDVESGAILAPGVAELNRGLCADPRLAQIAKIGSSDAHYVHAIGLCYTILHSARPTLDDARQAIIDGRTSPATSKACARLRRFLGVIPRFRKSQGFERSL